MSQRHQRVAIYLRVSKDDGSQDTDNQLLQLRGFCEGWDGHERSVRELFLPDHRSVPTVVVTNRRGD